MKVIVTQGIKKKKNPNLTHIILILKKLKLLFALFLYSSLENNEYSDFSKLDINILIIILER